MSMFIKDYWSGFREELIATSLVLIIAVAGSFVVVDRMLHSSNIQSSNTEETTKKQMANELAGAASNILGDAVELPSSMQLPSPTLTPIPTPTLEPTGNPFQSEVYYGTGGLYDNEQYKLSLASPRLTFDARDTQSRTFIVDLVLINKSVVAGLPTKLSATIVKDGVVIVPEAAMSITPNTLLASGQQTSYSARLSLIEGTDVSLVHYIPGNDVTRVDHILRP